MSITDRLIPRRLGFGHPLARIGVKDRQAQFSPAIQNAHHHKERVEKCQSRICMQVTVVSTQTLIGAQ